VLADSTRTLVLREASYPVVHYIPLDGVDRSALSPSDTTTYCPYKGNASYLNVDDGPADAVWQYAEPYPAVEQIAGHVAFYPDRVTIEIDGGRRD
jgi:uncharacterized protein (DUF427 family)